MITNPRQAQAPSRRVNQAAGGCQSRIAPTPARLRALRVNS